MPRHEPGPPETLTDTDYANLMRVPDRRMIAGKRHYVLLRVLGDCGLRSAELRGLRATICAARAPIAACGLELTLGLARADASYEQITTALALPPAERLQRGLRDAQPLRAARAERSRTPASVPTEVVGVLQALQQAGIHYVLVGELAEVLHGSPLLPMTGTVTIVPRVGQREALSAALAAAAGKPIASPPTSAIDAPAHFALEAYGAELVIEPAPAATQGL